jgi:hypothetical protein
MSDEELFAKILAFMRFETDTLEGVDPETWIPELIDEVLTKITAKQSKQIMQSLCDFLDIDFNTLLDRSYYDVDTLQGQDPHSKILAALKEYPQEEVLPTVERFFSRIQPDLEFFKKSWEGSLYIEYVTEDALITASEMLLGTNPQLVAEVAGRFAPALARYDTNYSLAEWVVNILAVTDGDNAADYFLKYLVHHGPGSTYVQNELIPALSLLGPKSVPKLMEAIDEENHDAILRALLEMTDDPSEEVYNWIASMYETPLEVNVSKWRVAAQVLKDRNHPKFLEAYFGHAVPEIGAHGTYFTQDTLPDFVCIPSKHDFEEALNHENEAIRFGLAWFLSEGDRDSELTEYQMKQLRESTPRWYEEL